MPIYRYYAILELNFCHSYFEINSSACKKVEGACPLRTYTGSLRLRPLVAFNSSDKLITMLFNKKLYAYKHTN